MHVLVRTGHRAVRILLVMGSVMLFELSWAAADSPTKNMEPTSTPVLRIEASLHSGDITSLDVDLGERFVVTGSADKTVRVWDLGTGKLLQTIRPPIGEGREGMIQTVAISPDGKTVAAGGDIGFAWEGTWSLYVFDRESGALIKRIGGLPQPAVQLAFSRDGIVLAAGLKGKGGIRVYQAADYRQVGADSDYGNPNYDGTVTGLAFDDAGNLVTVALDEELRRYDDKVKLIEKRRTYLARPSSVAISPDGNSIVIMSRETGDNRQLKREKGGFAGVSTAKLIGSRDAFGGLVAFARGGELMHFGGFEEEGSGYFDKADKTGMEHKTFKNVGLLYLDGVGYADDRVPFLFRGNGEYVTAYIRSRPIALRGLKDGGLLYATADSFGVLRPQKDPTPKRGSFENTTGKIIGMVTEVRRPAPLCCGGPVGSLRMSRDAATLEFADRSGDRPEKAGRWRFGLATGTLTELKGEQSSGGEDFQPPRTIARGMHLSEWENSERPVLNERPLPLSKGERSKAIAIPPDGKTVLVGTSHFIRLFNQDGSQRWQTQAEAGVSGLNIAADGKLAVASLEDGTLRWLRLSDGALMASLYIADAPRRWVLWSPKGYFDASPGADSLIGWHVNQGKDKAALFYPASQFFEQFYRPDLVAEVVGSGETDVQVLVRLGEKERVNLQAGLKLPPRVAILSPKQGEQFDKDEIDIQVQAQDQGGGVDEIRLFHNGKAVGGDARGISVSATGSGPAKAFRIRLVEGPNVFRAVALSKDRIEGHPAELTVLLKGAARPATLHLLLVGINEYKNPGLNLNYAIPDAKGVVEFFGPGRATLFKDVKRHELYDKAATKAAIVGKFKDLEKSAAQDVVVIYLAGHGESIGNTWYFVPYEVTMPEQDDRLKEQGLSSSELNEYVAKIGAQKILLLMDACKSGTAMAAFAARGLEDRKALAQLARSAGVHVIAASTKDQFAAEVKDLGHGVFTYTLLDGLSGKADGSPKDNTITVRELLSYVESRLPEVTEQYKQQAQYPVVDSRGMDFPLATVQ